MANSDHLTIIEQGVQAWNRWREEHPDIQPDLSRAYLFEVDLSGVNFSQTDLTRVCLIGANLKSANLQGATLRDAYGNASNLSDANLSRAELSGANFSEAQFTGANLSHAEAVGTNFTATHLTGVCLEGWQIDETTQFEGAECAYLYLSHHPQLRYPTTGDFSPGELAQRLKISPTFLTEVAADGAHPEANSEDSSTPSPDAETQDGGATPPPAPSDEPKTTPIASEEPLVNLSPPARSTPPGSNEPTSDRPEQLTSPLAAVFKKSPTLPSMPRKVLVGAGVALLSLLALTSLAQIVQRSPTPSPSAAPSESVNPGLDAATRAMSNLPCNEPPPLPLSGKQPSHEYSDGTQFFGNFEGGIPGDGRGAMVYANGDRYDGEYRNGKRNGCGTFTFVSGRRYVGQFKNDEFSGLGVWTMENGDRYIGEFEASRCNGQGTFISKDGSSKSGIWENGSLLDGNLSCDRDSSKLPDSPP